MSVTRRHALARSGAGIAGIAFTGALSELFVGTATAPITILGARDVAGVRDDAPVDRPADRGRGDRGGDA